MGHQELESGGQFRCEEERLLRPIRDIGLDFEEEVVKMLHLTEALPFRITKHMKIKKRRKEIRREL